MRIHFIHKFKYKPVKIHLFWRHLQLDVIFAYQKKSVNWRIGSVLYKQCEYYLILNNYSFYRLFRLIGIFFFMKLEIFNKTSGFFASLHQATNISFNMTLMSARKSRFHESLQKIHVNMPLTVLHKERLVPVAINIELATQSGSEFIEFRILRTCRVSLFTFCHII